MSCWLCGHRGPLVSVRIGAVRQLCGPCMFRVLLLDSAPASPPTRADMPRQAQYTHWPHIGYHATRRAEVRFSWRGVRRRLVPIR